MGEESKDLQDQMEELDDIHENLGNQAEEMRLKVASSAYKAAKQAQCIRQLSKEDRGRIVSVASSASWLWRYSSYSPAENRKPLRLHGVQLGGSTDREGESLASGASRVYLSHTIVPSLPL